MQFKLNNKRKFFIACYLVGIFLLSISCMRLFKVGSKNYYIKIKGTSEFNFYPSGLDKANLAIFKKTHRELQGYSSGSQRLMVFMSPADCPSCFQELETWNRLSMLDDSKKLKVIGIIVRSSEKEALQLVKAYNPQFELYIDETNQLETLVGLPAKTPFCALLDKDNNLLLAHFSFGSEIGSQALEDQVINLIAKD